MQNKKIKNKFSSLPRNKKLNSLADKLLGDISLRGHRSFYSEKEREAFGIKPGTPRKNNENTVHNRRCKGYNDNDDLVTNDFGSSRDSSRAGQFVMINRKDRTGPGDYKLSLLRTQNTFKHFKYTNKCQNIFGIGG